eukprot:CAMPEP_0182867938 /NCGR_PEP_ID=MMETSP0034_2-20130328/9017_1 /TAXON_ID=156128 /ORGANISM="Nephroselmis pyriformis, Strain CCMP717" /LENGTH=266 /DNA_ID=CAMNT_0025000325 /DNA_START=204 /DNA_END=1000 /DNA_ORIENTATION=-
MEGYPGAPPAYPPAPGGWGAPPPGMPPGGMPPQGVDPRRIPPGMPGAENRNDRTVYVGNLNATTDEATLHTLFMHCGQVTQIRIAGEAGFDTRYAFVEFADPSMINTAILLDGMEFYDRPLRVSKAASNKGSVIGGAPKAQPSDPERCSRTIHVGGIPMTEVTEEQLAEYFSAIGQVGAVRISGRFAWVEFEDAAFAMAALALDGETLGNHTMTVTTSKTPIHTAGWRKDKPGGDKIDTNEICRYYARGHCARGDECKFQHLNTAG